MEDVLLLFLGNYVFYVCFVADSLPPALRTASVKATFTKHELHRRLPSVTLNLHFT